MCNLNLTLDLYGLAPGSIVDGPGIRFAIFMQGCSHHCKGCHNLESHAYGKGTKWELYKIIEEYDKQQSCDGVTFSGGEPFDQSESLSELALYFKTKGKNIWCYTGYNIEDLLMFIEGKDNNKTSKYCNKDFSASINKLLNNIDVLVDGEFKEEQKSYDALYCGSKNQRLIDVQKTLKTGTISFWTQEFIVPERPSSW